MNEQEINGLINDAICAALALKDAELATLKACVVKLQESLCAAKLQDYEAMVATPAPIQSAEVAELRKLAMAATPGPWDRGSYGGVFRADGEGTYVVASGSLNGTWCRNHRPDEAWIAAANPAAILRLLDAFAATPAQPIYQVFEESSQKWDDVTKAQFDGAVKNGWESRALYTTDAATPAQPIAPTEDDKALMHAIAHGTSWLRQNSDGTRTHIPYEEVYAAQPIADVSAPTDEPTAWALLAECDPQVTTDPELGDYWKRKGRNVTELYARAAAPVSGPTEQMQQFRYALEVAMQICDAVPTRLHESRENQQLAHLGMLVNARPDGMQGYAIIRDALDAARAATPEILFQCASAAPVSGQDASIGDDVEFQSLMNRFIANEDFQAQAIYGQIVAYIDSRTRSEDSRISGLEAARIAYASEFPPNADGEPDVGNIHANIRKLKASSEDSRAKVLEEVVRLIEGMFTHAPEVVNAINTRIRALASTPPKA